MLNDLHSIKEAVRDESEKTSSLKDIQDLKVKYLGKKGLLTSKLKDLGSLPKEQRPAYGSLLNETKKYIETLLDEQEEAFKSSELNRSLQTQQIDIT
ncbi:MAG: phenylalanine--tRNA ligase subunit alpha, partial [Nitrospirota bacterium]